MPKRAIQMNMRGSFWDTRASEGPRPGDPQLVEVWNCWMGVDSVWLRDYESALANGTHRDLTIRMRDTRGEFIPKRDMKLTVDSPYFRKGQTVDGELITFNVKEVMPDLVSKVYIFLKVEDVS